MNILPIQNFCADLCERTEDAVVFRHELPRLREAGAVYRADTCLRRWLTCPTRSWASSKGAWGRTWPGRKPCASAGWRYYSG